MGFKFRYRLSGNAPTIRNLQLKDGETVDEGDMVAASTSGTIATASSDTATALLGVATGTQAESSASYVEVIVDDDAVYGVADANARYVGDTLTLLASGCQVGTPAASNDGILLVVETSASTEETRVRIIPEFHLFTRTSDNGSRVA